MRKYQEIKISPNQWNQVKTIVKSSCRVRKEETNKMICNINGYCFEVVYNGSICSISINHNQEIIEELKSL